MADKAFGDGAIDNLPWASIFDPAANARALSAVQSEGFRAARRIIDKFADGAAAGGSNSTGLPELERFTRTWWSTTGQLLLRTLPAPPHAGDGAGPDALMLQAARPGSAAGEVWLHNRESDDGAPVRLRCSELLGHNGGMIGADAVRIDPAEVPMPRRSSRGVQITVDIGPEVPVDTYRGAVLAVGHPELWLPVMLTVTAPDP